MKVFRITAKNLKLLMRSKTSMFVIIFGPLIIMLLVGFAFSNPSASKLNIGYIPKEKTNLTVEFLDVLKSNPNFALVEYDSEQKCKDNIEQGNLHLCIVFPNDFNIENNKTNEIIFYVDQSRANFVYSIIDSVSQKISFTSSQLSTEMTGELLSVISFAQKSNSEQLVKIIALKNSVNDLSTKLKDIQTKLSALNLSAVSVDTSEMSDWADNIKIDVNDIKLKSDSIVSSGKSLVSDLEDYGDLNSNASSRLNDFDEELDDKKSIVGNSTKKATDDIDLLIDVIDTISLDIDVLNKKLEKAKTTNTDVSGKIADIQVAYNTLKTEFDNLKGSIEKTNAQINAIEVTSVESIVNPIKTTVTPLTTKASNLNFVFPYLVILIIAFISMMLSSTIILMEKTSKAYFRNFTTPTKDFTFIISVFLTSFIVVVLQLVFIMILAYYFLNTTLTSSIGLSLLLLVCAITLFTFFGMIIGYMFNSQEAATMASISVGSVFFFLSNVVLPLESMTQVVRDAAKFNPYVVVSELLKKLTLFGSSWNEVYMEFLLVFSFIIGSFILVLLVEKMSKMHYISRKPVTKIIKKEDIIDKYLKLRTGVLIRNEKELLEELRGMSDLTFLDYVTLKKNDFESWLLLNNKPELAKIVGQSRTRQEMIASLEKYSSSIIDPLKKR